ncbi:MAG TPA: PDZ domain-containing protein [Candidatus Polarisedimenticolia bacterium]|jgi:hypothetical protein|nr:PDZ domain-containing protein [Candidatus Polarisedimenticolia bacterium]
MADKRLKYVILTFSLCLVALLLLSLSPASTAGNRSAVPPVPAAPAAAPREPSPPPAPDAPDAPEARRAWLGVVLSEDEEGRGVRITDVKDGSPAAKAGLQEGDRILELDGHDVDDAGDIRRAMRDVEPGDSVQIRIKRRSSEKTLNATLGESPRSRTFHKRAGPGWFENEEGETPEPMPFGMLGMSRNFMGVRVQGMTEDLRAYFKAPRGRGVLVSRVEEDTPAAKAGLRAGDVIIAVDGKGISERGDIAEALSDHEPGDRVAVKIVRDGSDKTVDVEIAERSRPRHRSMFLPEEHDHEMEKEEEEEASPEVEESVLESLRQAHDEIERASSIDFSMQMSAAEAALRQAGMLDRRSQEEIQRQIERSMQEARDAMRQASSIDVSKQIREAQAALRQAGMFDRRNQQEIQRQIERSMQEAQDAMRQAAERMSEESSF